MSGLFLSTLKETVKSHPHASNVIFSFLLVVLEKLVDMEFVCPCKRLSENSSFVSAFFILPSVLAFILMISLQNDNITGNENCCKKFCNSIIPAVAWIVILLFDGRYVACGMTYWPGKYVTADADALVKWCETDNSTLKEERLMDSQEWYFHSQCAGLVFTLAMVFVACVICIMNCANKQSSRENGIPIWKILIREKKNINSSETELLVYEDSGV